MRRFLRFAASPRLAAALIAALAGVALLGVVFPQRNVFGASTPTQVTGLGLDRVFSSVPFIVIVGLLGVNVTVCTVLRIVRRVRRAPRLPQTAPVGARLIRTRLTPEAALDAAAGTLRGWRVSRADGVNALRADSGDIGFVGSLAEHVGLVVLIAGGVLSALTQFSGVMLLTEGQTLPDAPQSYVSIDRRPAIGPVFGDFSVRLDSLDFTYERDTVTDALARMTVTSAAGVRPAEARVNQPLAVQGKSMFLLSAGYAVDVRVDDPSGTPIIDSFVALGRVHAEGYADDLKLPSTEWSLLGVPDSTLPTGTAARQRLNIVSPALTVRAADGTILRLLPGQTGRLGKYTVTFRSMRRWNRFLVRADRGRYVAYLAFGMLVFGAALRFSFPDRHVAVLATPSSDGADLTVWGRSTFGGIDRVAERLALLGSDDGSET